MSQTEYTLEQIQSKFIGKRYKDEYNKIWQVDGLYYSEVNNIVTIVMAYETDRRFCSFDEFADKYKEVTTYELGSVWEQPVPKRIFTVVANGQGFAEYDASELVPCVCVRYSDNNELHIITEDELLNTCKKLK